MLILLHKNKKVYATGGEKMKKSAAYMPFSLHKQSVFVVINFSLYGGPASMLLLLIYLRRWWRSGAGGYRRFGCCRLLLLYYVLCCVYCSLSVCWFLSCVLQFLFALLYHPFVIAYDVSVSHTFGCPVAYM